MGVLVKSPAPVAIVGSVTLSYGAIAIDVGERAWGKRRRLDEVLEWPALFPWFLLHGIRYGTYISREGHTIGLVYKRGMVLW